MLFSNIKNTFEIFRLVCFSVFIIYTTCSTIDVQLLYHTLLYEQEVRTFFRCVTGHLVY